MDNLWIIYGYGWWLSLHPSEKYEDSSIGMMIIPKINGKISQSCSSHHQPLQFLGEQQRHGGTPDGPMAIYLSPLQWLSPRQALAHVGWCQGCRYGNGGREMMVKHWNVLVPSHPNKGFLIYRGTSKSSKFSSDFPWCFPSRSIQRPGGTPSWGATGPSSGRILVGYMRKDPLRFRL